MSTIEESVDGARACASENCSDVVSVTWPKDCSCETVVCNGLATSSDPLCADPTDSLGSGVTSVTWCISLLDCWTESIGSMINAECASWSICTDTAPATYLLTGFDNDAFAFVVVGLL